MEENFKNEDHTAFCDMVLGSDYFKNEDHTAFCDMIYGSDNGFSDGDREVLYLYSLVEKYGRLF